PGRKAGRQEGRQQGRKEGRQEGRLHLSGMDDKRVPPFIAELYVKTSNSPCVKKQTFPNISHAKGWDKVWSNILDIPLICN
ncbi:MAG: hypothetical protein O7C71_00585, partial [Rickettsia endosymbiont of Ixodes ricinus]|nr:hypothetical protein [Rickettsia endosymbiont of Ixodes ricinus]